MNTLSEYEKGWISGLIDGEGCINFCRYGGHNGHYIKYKAALFITNTNLELLQKIQIVIGSGTIASPKVNLSERKQIYVYMIPPNIQRELLPQITLVAKEKQRVLLLEALSLLTGKGGQGHLRDEQKDKRLTKIFYELKSLNRRGPIHDDLRIVE